MEDEERLASGYTIRRDVDLECGLAFVPSTPGLLEPYGLSPLLIIRP
jgi:hypothetical protein